MVGYMKDLMLPTKESGAILTKCTMKVKHICSERNLLSRDCRKVSYTAKMITVYGSISVMRDSMRNYYYGKMALRYISRRTSDWQTKNLKTSLTTKASM